MMVGTSIAGFKVYHSINRQTSQEVLEAGERLVTESFPAMIQHIDRFKRILVNTERQYRFADKAMKLRYPGLAPFPVDDLLTVRREDDREPSLWNILNRVQESVMYGGWTVKGMMSSRTSMVRPIERVSAVTAINTGLWDAAEALAEEIENES